MDQLNNADRDLTPDQLAALSKSISKFLGVKFEVHVYRRQGSPVVGDEVNRCGEGGKRNGATFGELQSLPPRMIFVFAVKDTDLRRDISDAVGRRLAAARITAGVDFSAEQPEHTVTIIVGKKP